MKEAFVDAALKQRFELSSANSINLGRLLPQAVYYAATSLAVHRAHGVAPNFVIPSGNLGNSVACVWARKLGLPIGRIVLAHNANRTVPDFLAERAVAAARRAFRRWLRRWTSARLATWNACAHCFRTSMRCAARCAPKASRDDEIRSRTIAAISASTGKPGVRIRPPRPRSTRACPAERASGRWVLVSTAHPAKFREIVEPLTGQRIEMPESLAKLFSRPVSCADLEPDARGAHRRAGENLNERAP